MERAFLPPCDVYRSVSIVTSLTLIVAPSKHQNNFSRVQDVITRAIECSQRSLIPNGNYCLNELTPKKTFKSIEPRAYVAHGSITEYGSPGFTVSTSGSNKTRGVFKAEN